MKDSNTVVSTKITENGVINVTLGHLAYYQMARTAVVLLKDTSPDGYAAYKAAKYPDGEATAESRKAAYKLACELAGSLPLYERVLTDEAPEAPEA